jgi:hypothetical protein
VVLVWQGHPGVAPVRVFEVVPSVRLRSSAVTPKLAEPRID